MIGQCPSLRFDGQSYHNVCGSKFITASENETHNSKLKTAEKRELSAINRFVLSLFISPHTVALLIFFYLSLSPVRLPSIHKLVDSELYYDLTARSLVKIICLGERKKIAADTLAKQSVHSYLVPFGCGRSFHIFDLFIVGKLRVDRLPQFLYKPLAHLL